MRTLLSVIASFILGISLLFFTFFYCVQSDKRLVGGEIKQEEVVTTTTTTTETTTTTTVTTKKGDKKTTEKVTSQVVSEDDIKAEDIKKEDLTFDKLKEIIMGQNYEERGLDPAIANYMLKDYDTNPYYEEWRDNYLNYLQGKVTDYKIDRDRVEAIVQRAIEAYNKDHEDKHINEEALFKLVDDSENKADELLDKVNNDKNIQNVIKFIFNENYKKYAFIICIACIVLLIVLNLVNSVVYLKSPFMINSVLAFIGLGILKAFGKPLPVVLGNRYTYMTSNLTTFAILYLIIGIVCIIINILLKNYIKAKNDPVIQEQERKRQEKKKRKNEEKEDEEEE